MAPVPPEHPSEFLKPTIATPDNSEPFERADELAFIHLSWQEFERIRQRTQAPIEFDPDSIKDSDYNPKRDGVIIIEPVDRRTEVRIPRHTEILARTFQTEVAEMTEATCLNAGYIYNKGSKEKKLVFSISGSLKNYEQRLFMHLEDDKRETLARNTATVLGMVYQKKGLQFSALKPSRSEDLPA